MVMRILLLMVLLCTLNHTAFADDYSITTSIECGGIKSYVVSKCENRKAPYCISQMWNVDDVAMNLNADMDSSFVTSRWACLHSSGGFKVVFKHVNWGNCDECELYTVWDVDGSSLKGRYNDYDFPKAQGENFHEQFHKINLRVK